MSNCGDVIWTMWETSSQKCLITSRLKIIEINNLYFYTIFGKLLREKTAQAYDFALEKIGRKVPYTVCLLLAGLSLVSIAVIPHRVSLLIVWECPFIACYLSNDFLF